MRLVSNVLFGIGLFLGIAAAVYGFTAHEPIGSTLFVVGSLTFLALGLVARSEARRAGAEGQGEEELVHVGPTIWPLGFALASVLLALGLIVSPWFFVAGGLLAGASATGWLRAVARSHAGVHDV